MGHRRESNETSTPSVYEIWVVLKTGWCALSMSAKVRIPERRGKEGTERSFYGFLLPVLSVQRCHSVPVTEVANFRSNLQTCAQPVGVVSSGKSYQSKGADWKRRQGLSNLKNDAKKVFRIRSRTSTGLQDIPRRKHPYLLRPLFATWSTALLANKISIFLSLAPSNTLICNRAICHGKNCNNTKINRSNYPPVFLFISSFRLRY